ncbi:MAG: hypothetical protein L0387_41360 [Acidobacteria bacterium]|nr:hypothetical protein [Acidobacteriota bacterium]
MTYESEMRQLARGAIAAHGELKEVVFVEKNADSLLIFSDGTVFPICYQVYGYDIGTGKEAYAYGVSIQLAACRRERGEGVLC